MERLGVIFLSPGDAEGETSEKLEFDDPLNENAMFLRSQGLQNEAKMVPKRPERRKRRREEAKREQRSAKRCSRERLGSSPNENAMFLRSQGLQNKGQNGTKTARGEEKRQRRSEKRAEKRQKCAQERRRSALERLPTILRVPGGGTVERTTPFALPSRPCVSEGLSPKSDEKCCKVARFRDLAISSIFASQ